MTQNANFQQSHSAILNNQCAETYIIDHPVSMNNGAAACDAAFDELTPILLGACYLLGLNVTVKRSIPASYTMIMQPTDRWPRERAIGARTPIVSSDAAMIDRLEKFIATWPSAGQVEKALFLVHHWLDALACWSFEDMYLSATTLLQVIAATEEGRQGKNLNFFQGVTDASGRFGIAQLKSDFKDMRNDLVHAAGSPVAVLLESPKTIVLRLWLMCSTG